MIPEFRRKWKCKKCGTESPAEGEFSQWCRFNLMSPQAGLVISDIDFIYHRYSVQGDRDVQFQMCVEVKTRCKDLKPQDSQYETLVFDHRSQTTHNHNCERNRGRWTTDNGGTKPVRMNSPRTGKPVWLNHFGWFLLRFDGTHPFDSQWIEWDRKLIDESMLKQVLQLDVNPRTLRPINERRRKTKKQFPLFGESP